MSEENERKHFETKVAGSSDNEYDVSYLENRPDWHCTCPAFKFGGGKPCKHINAVIAEHGEVPSGEGVS